MARCRVFAVVNQKGGVGKTTTAVNLAASFAASERSTLLVDLDPQANATSAFGVGPPARHVYDALIGRCVMKDVTLPTDLRYLQLVPSGRDLYGAEIELVSAASRERCLEIALVDLKDVYDIVVIDCPPSLGLLTLNALGAADSVLIPLQCEYYALEGLAGLLETVDQVRARFNPELHLEGIVLTMSDPRNNLSRQVEAEVRNHFGDRVFSTRIPRNVRLSEAPSHGKPVILYDVHSKGAVAYLQLAQELLRRIDAGSALAVAAEASVIPVPAHHLRQGSEPIPESGPQPVTEPMTPSTSDASSGFPQADDDADRERAIGEDVGAPNRPPGGSDEQSA